MHGANGYLITQFLDSTANQHTDKWEGSPENPSRFGLEVWKALTEVYGPDVGVRCRVCFSNISVSLVCKLSFPFYRMLLQETLDIYSYFIAEVDANRLRPSTSSDIHRYMTWHITPGVVGDLSVVLHRRGRHQPFTAVHLIGHS